MSAQASFAEKPMMVLFFDVEAWRQPRAQRDVLLSFGAGR